LSEGSDQRARDEKETARLEAFSDGVFAIAITLLVLDLKIPHDAAESLNAQLLAQWPAYLAYFTSFATIGIMWINHHRLFLLIRRVDHRLLLLNLFLLLGVSIVPFPTQLVADHLGRAGETEAVSVYAAASIYIAISFNVLWRYASSAKRQPVLLNVPHDAPEVIAIHEQYRFGPWIYAIAGALALWNAKLGFALMVALAVFFLIPPRPRDAQR
jgi:uncharacterized membrane protein